MIDRDALEAEFHSRPHGLKAEWVDLTHDEFSALRLRGRAEDAEHIFRVHLGPSLQETLFGVPVRITETPGEQRFGPPVDRSRWLTLDQAKRLADARADELARDAGQ